MVSPGTVVEGSMLSKSNNFLAAINETDDEILDSDDKTKFTISSSSLLVKSIVPY